MPTNSALSGMAFLPERYTAPARQVLEDYFSGDNRTTQKYKYKETSSESGHFLTTAKRADSRRGEGPLS